MNFDLRIYIKNSRITNQYGNIFQLRRVYSTKYIIPFECCEYCLSRVDRFFMKCYSARSHSQENNDCDIIILTSEIKRKLKLV